MTDWVRSRDALLRQLREHAADCLLCDLAHPGARIHNACQNGVVLLTEWQLAKCYAEQRPAPLPQPTNTEATP